MHDVPWELVIFDNDGVVVDSEPLASVATSQILTSLGHPMTPDECDQAFRGISLPNTRRWVEQGSGRPLPADFEDRYLARVAELIRSQLRPVPGIVAVLDILDAAALPYCVASSSRREVISLALRTTGLSERFAGRWWGADDVAEGKPAPDLFLLAAKSMGPGRRTVSSWRTPGPAPKPGGRRACRCSALPLARRPSTCPRPTIFSPIWPNSRRCCWAASQRRRR